MADEFSINAKITANTSDFEKGVDKAKKSANGLSNGLDTLSKTIKTLFVSGVIAKLGKAFADMALDFGQATSQIAKGTGAVGEELKSLSASVSTSLINGVGRSAKEVGSMVADLNTRFGSVGEELNLLVDDFDMFSRVTNQDTKTAINSVADVMYKWQIETTDLNKLLDQFVKASQMSGISISELTSGLTSGQAIFSQFGMNVSQSISFLSLLSKNGIDSSNAILGMRTALSKFSQEGKNAEVEFKKISEQIKNAKSESEALNIAIDVFGTRSGPEMVRVLRSETLNLNEFEKSLSKAGGTLKTTDEISRTSKDALMELKSTITGIVSLFAGDSDKNIRNTIDTIREFIASIDFTEVIDTIEEFKEIFVNVFNFLIQVGLIFYENFQNVFNKFINSLGTVNINLSEWKNTIYSILNNMYKYWQDVFAGISALLKGDFVVAWEYAKLAVMRAANVMLDIISAIANAFPGLINKMIDALNSLIDKLNTVRGWFDKAPLEMLKSFSSIDLANTLGLDSAIEKSERKIEELTGKAADNSLRFITQIKDANEDYVSSSVEGEIHITDITEIESEKRENKINKEINNTVKKVFEMTKTIVNSFVNISKKISETFKNVTNIISKSISTSFNLIKRISEMNISDMLDELLIFEDAILTFIVETLPNLPKFINNAMKSIISMLKSINVYIKRLNLSDIIYEILQSISENLPEIVEEFIDVLGKIISEAVIGIAKWIQGGGLKKVLQSLLKVQKGIEKIVTDNIGKIVDLIIETLPDIMETIKDSIISASHTLSKLVGPLTSVITEIILQLIEVITSQEVIDASLKAIESIIEAMIKDGRFVQIITSLASGIIRIVANIPELFLAIATGIFKGLLNMDWAELGKAIGRGFLDIAGSVVGYNSSSSAQSNATTIGMNLLVPGLGTIGSWFDWWATGVNNAPAGLSIVGEEGPELIDMKGGERVYNSDDTKSILSSTSSSNNFNITFNNIKDTSAYTMMRQLKQYNRQMAINGVL